MNAYLHIPFCGTLCSYCDFTSFAGRDERIPAYVRALVSEIDASDLAGPLLTAYFGGGCPSRLSPDQVSAVLTALSHKAPFAPGAEVSLEANPDDVGPERLEGYRRAGINRLSMGAQAAQDDLLRALGRRHDFTAVRRAVADARAAGFQNLNLDVMFGLPGQSTSMLDETLRRFIDLGPDHVSLYALQLEPGTPMTRRVEAGLAAPDDDEQADQYEAARERLAAAGYAQYEVSNFAKPGHECRHNLAVWRGEDYGGVGVAAVGTMGLQRISHGDDLELYLKGAASGDFGVEREILSEATRLRERCFLGLRTREGVPRETLLRAAVRPEPLERLVREGWLKEENGRIAPSPKAYFVLHGVLTRLFA